MESLTVVVPGDSVPVLFSVLIPFLQKVYNFQVSAVKGQKEIKVNKGKDIKSFHDQFQAFRYLIRHSHLDGNSSNDLFSISEIDGWIDFAVENVNESVEFFFKTLQEHLHFRTVLVQYHITAADLVIYSILKEKKDLNQYISGPGKDLVNATRWFHYLEYLIGSSQNAAHQKDEQPQVVKTFADAAALLNVGAQASFSSLELTGAVKGQVVTRFPPEPSGYMHLGHCKAALLNDYYARHFEGKLLVRFDDTNPTKEKAEYVESILEDIKTLGIKPYKISYTSDHFVTIINYAEKLLKEGKVYIDDSPAEEISKGRELGIESPRRNSPVKDNLERWKQMKEATQEGQKCVMRAKIDMKSKNGVMRDPNFFRVIDAVHYRTGNKFKVYPLYDFACPIVDSIEGVTHPLRSSEYHDRNALYDWVIEATGLRKPIIEDFSRLNFAYTLLSKRKLQWIVDQGIVDGWDDPRFPTVKGVLRRGLTVEALRAFILSLGPAKTLNLMEIEKLWSLNRKIIDPVIPRYTVIADEGLGKVRVTLSNGPKKPEFKTVPRHKKNPYLGNKVISLTSTIFIEREDSVTLKENEEITLMDWGNAIIEKISKHPDGEISDISARLHLEGDYKQTEKKLTWLPDVSDLVKITLVEFDHLITKKKMEENDDIKDFVNRASRFETLAVGDLNIRLLKKGDRIQCERRGYWIVDEPYITASRPVVLFNIPDGHTSKEQSILKSKIPKRFDEEHKSEGKKEIKKEEPKKQKKEESKKESTKKEEPKKEPQVISSNSTNSELDALTASYTEQGNVVRSLKEKKADPALIKTEVDKLLKLKEDILAKGGVVPTSQAPKEGKKEESKKESVKKEEPKKEPQIKSSNSTNSELDALTASYTEQGNVVRSLKEKKADPALIKAEVDKLLKIKEDILAKGGVVPTSQAPKKDKK